MCSDIQGGEEEVLPRGDQQHDPGQDARHRTGVHGRIPQGQARRGHRARLLQ